MTPSRFFFFASLENVKETGSESLNTFIVHFKTITMTLLVYKLLLTDCNRKHTIAKAVSQVEFYSDDMYIHISLGA